MQRVWWIRDMFPFVCICTSMVQVKYVAQRNFTFSSCSSEFYTVLWGFFLYRCSSSKLFAESRRLLYYVARVLSSSSYVLVIWSNAQQYQ
jgi:hypothetical protein